MVNKRTPGRPGHDIGARDAILGAATAAFSRRGFDGTTIRQVAADAAVDPALVLHYFRSKRGLYVAAVAFPFDPRAAIDRVFGAGPAGAGERLVALVLEAWDPAGRYPVMLTLLRSAVSDDDSAALFRERLTRDILAPIVERLGSDQPEWRASLAAAHVAGLGLARFVVRIEPLVSTPREAVIAAVGPVIQHYLTGDLGRPATVDGGTR